MENSALAELIDQERWLLNNGLISDSVKNQLFFCGSIVHKDVQAVECQVKPEDKRVAYTIYVPSGLIKKIEKYKKLSKTKSLFGLWRFKRLLKREGCLNFTEVLSSFIHDYCGSKWSVDVSVEDFGKYIDKNEGRDGGNGVTDKPLNAG